jgi:hypothetical protein
MTSTAPCPIIQLVPLPVSAQLLNVIEGVYSAKTKADIHNSDYQSADEMKAAISRHFAERNAYNDSCGKTQFTENLV